MTGATAPFRTQPRLRPGRRIPFAAALLSGVLAVLPVAPACAGLETGRQHFRNGDLDKAFGEFRIAAEAGEAEAQFLVGQMLANGQGTAKDVPAALLWLDRAAQAGHTGARMMAGTILAFGDGVPVDYARALSYLEPAAQAGDPLAQNNLAVLLHYGLGTPADPVRAMAWVMRAERSGLVQAINFRQEVEKTITPAEMKAATALLPTLPGPPPRPAREPVASPLDVPAQMAEERPAAPPAETAAPQPQPRPAEPPKPEPEPQPQPEPQLQPQPEPAQVKTAATMPPPALSPAPTSPAAPWSVQVAALQSDAEAQRQWRAISGRQAALLDGVPMEIARVDLGERGVFHRILVGAFPDREAATAFCGRLKEAGQDCLIRRR